MLVLIEAIQKAWMDGKGPQALAGCSSAPPQATTASPPDADVTRLPSAMRAAGTFSSAGSIDSSGWTTGVRARGGLASAVATTSGATNTQPGARRQDSARHGNPRASSATPQGEVHSAGCLGSSGDAASQRASPFCPLSTQRVLASGCSQATAAAEETYGKITPGLKRLKGKQAFSFCKE